MHTGGVEEQWPGSARRENESRMKADLAKQEARVASEVPLARVGRAGTCDLHPALQRERRYPSDWSRFAGSRYGQY